MRIHVRDLQLVLRKKSLIEKNNRIGEIWEVFGKEGESEILQAERSFAKSMSPDGRLKKSQSIPKKEKVHE